MRGGDVVLYNGMYYNFVGTLYPSPITLEEGSMQQILFPFLKEICLGKFIPLELKNT